VAILPARQSIEQIFEKFLAGKDQEDEDDGMLFEMCEKLSVWFKKICASFLLYNQAEQEQLAKVQLRCLKHYSIGNGILNVC